jgi:hypothetical protein
MAALRLEIPTLPPALNGPSGLLRMHFTKRRKVADRWAMLLLVARGRDRQRFCRCEVKVTFYTSRFRDPDGAYASLKLPLDELVKLEVLKDDGPDVIHRLTVEQVKVKRTEVKTVIEIQEVESAE